MRSVAGALSALVLLGACATGRMAGRQGGAPAVLVVHCESAEAVVWIDERRVGEVGELAGGVPLRPGAHRVEVRQDGRFSRYVDVTVAPGERRVLAVALAEILE